MFKQRKLILAGLWMAMLTAGSRAQEPVPTPTQTGPVEQAPQQPAANATASAQKPPTKSKHGKGPYTGPANVIELPPTPMLDEEGKQRLDPDGKPMFNPPVLQQRDKKGHPVFAADGKPVFQTATELGYDEKSHKLHAKKEKPPKTVAVDIARGTLTVDGMIGKAGLNYEIKDFRYVYLYAPWIGTVVVSNVMFPGAKEQPKGFDQNTLTVTVDEHTFQVYSEKMLLGKKPEPAYVLVDRDFRLPTKDPLMGYGETVKAPYNWPGAKPNPEAKAFLQPPLPVGLRPTMLLPPCPPGQMRKYAGVMLPADKAQENPCLAIVVGAVATPAPVLASPTAAPAPQPPPQ